MLATLIFCGSSALVAAYVAFRRVTSRLTTQQLMELKTIQALVEEHNQKKDKKVVLEVVSQLRPEEKEVHKEGFLKGPDFRWIAVGEEQEQGTDKDKDKDHNTKADDDHKKVTFYMVECMLRFIELYGIPVVCRDAETGAYLGSIHLLSPYPSHTRYEMHFLRSVLPMGRPVPTTIGNDRAAARFNAFITVQHESNQVMKERSADRFWYVANLGVAPAAQGQGVGRLLLNVAKEVVKATDGADSDGNHLPLLLECHDGNVPFYQKCGYTQAKRFGMVPKYDKNDKETQDGSNATPSSLSYNCMVLEH